jgi:putative intracellular protease/amidase
MKLLDHTVALSGLCADHFDAFFLPGGHGAVFDMPDSTDLKNLLSKAFVAGKVVSAVCHGPAGLVNVLDGSGKPIVNGRKVRKLLNGCTC